VQSTLRRLAIKFRTSQGIRQAFSAAAAFAGRLVVAARGGVSVADEAPRTGCNPADDAPVAAERGLVPAEERSGVAAMLKWANSRPVNEADGPAQASSFKPSLDDGTETSPG